MVDHNIKPPQDLLKEPWKQYIKEYLFVITLGDVLKWTLYHIGFPEMIMLVVRRTSHIFMSDLFLVIIWLLVCVKQGYNLFTVELEYKCVYSFYESISSWGGEWTYVVFKGWSSRYEKEFYLVYFLVVRIFFIVWGRELKCFFLGVVRIENSKEYLHGTDKDHEYDRPYDEWYRASNRREHDINYQKIS